MSEYSGLNSKYLRIQDMRRMKNLFFSSRRVVEGQYAGRHASPMRGHSVEFNDYRQYIPGDELGDVDWKVYGRSDKLFVKLFEHQSDMTVTLVVDASASMAYAGLSGDYSKYDHAMAAAVAFLTTKQQDKVSFAVAQEGLKEFHRPHGSMGHLLSILRSMEATRPAGQARLGQAIRKSGGMVSRRGLMVIFSDLLDDAEDVFSAISAFTHRGGEAIFLHVLHTDEFRLPDVHQGVFEDSETAGRISVNVEDIRSAYDRRFNQFLATW